MRTLIIEDRFGKSGYTWWQKALGVSWHVVSAGGNRGFANALSAVADGSPVYLLLDVVGDNDECLHVLRSIRKYVRINKIPCTILTYNGFESMLLESKLPIAKPQYSELLDAFIAHSFDHRDSSILVNYMTSVYGTNYTQSSEKLAKQLIVNCVIDCASIRRGVLGDFWLKDCLCEKDWLNCEPLLLLDKNRCVLKSVNYDFFQIPEDGLFVPQSMIVEYGSKEAAIVHVREMRR